MYQVQPQAPGLPGDAGLAHGQQAGQQIGPGQRDALGLRGARAGPQRVDRRPLLRQGRGQLRGVATDAAGLPVEAVVDQSDVQGMATLGFSVRGWKWKTRQRLVSCCPEG